MNSRHLIAFLVAMSVPALLIGLLIAEGQAGEKTDRATSLTMPSAR